MSLCYFCSSSTTILFEYETPILGEVKIYPINAFPRRITKCLSCGHCQEVLSGEVEGIYEGVYSHKTYGDLQTVNSQYLNIRDLPFEKSDNYQRVKHLLQFISDQNYFSNKKLLDVGCGLSVFPKVMQERGWDVEVIDLDETFVEHARKLGLNSWRGNLEDFTSKDFGLITFNKVLEHVNDPKKLLTLGKKLLSNRGFIYLEVPDAAAQLRGREREEFLSGHIHIFSEKSLKILIESCNLALVQLNSLVEPSGKFTHRAICTFL